MSIGLIQNSYGSVTKQRISSSLQWRTRSYTAVNSWSSSRRTSGCTRQSRGISHATEESWKSGDCRYEGCSFLEGVLEMGNFLPFFFLYFFHSFSPLCAKCSIRLRIWTSKVCRSLPAITFISFLMIQYLKGWIMHPAP